LTRKAGVEGSADPNEPSCDEQEQRDTTGGAAGRPERPPRLCLAQSQALGGAEAPTPPLGTVTLCRRPLVTGH
jgi:hypothetical protein